MRKLACHAAALVLLLPALAPETRADEIDEGNDKAALAAILAVGIGIAAIAAHNKDKDKDDWDNGRYGEPFSPSSGVVCLPKVRKCYKNDRLSEKWTERIFGADGLGQHVKWKGSFERSCRKTRTDRDGNLVGECRNERDHWKSAFLAERSCKSHRAGNDNGRLVCEDGGGFGGSGGSHQVRWSGSFKGSCRDAQTDGSGNLRASCKKQNGRFERAFLAERGCRSHRAGNDNGRLVCES